MVLTRSQTQLAHPPVYSTIESLANSESYSDFEDFLSDSSHEHIQQSNGITLSMAEPHRNSSDNLVNSHYSTTWPKHVDLSAWMQPEVQSPHPGWRESRILTPPNPPIPTPESSFNSTWTPRSMHTSPAYAKIIKEKMRSDYDQGYPRGVKYINITLNNHLAQLGRDLDRAWKTVQDSQDVLEDEIKLRESPRRLGRLFELNHTHQLLHDLEEVTELVISRYILTSALTNNASATSDMDRKLHTSWMYFRAELNDALNKIESFKSDSLTAGDLYSRYQQEIYNRIYDYHPETLEELQVGMEQLRAQHDIRFPNEDWPVERTTQWLELPN